MPEGWLTFVERSQSLESLDTSFPVNTLNLAKNSFSQFPFDLVCETRLSVRSVDLSENRLGNVPPEDMNTHSQVPAAISHNAEHVDVATCLLTILYCLVCSIHCILQVYSASMLLKTPCPLVICASYLCPISPTE
jgi:hypothetical protein